MDRNINRLMDGEETQETHQVICYSCGRPESVARVSTDAAGWFYCHRCGCEGCYNVPCTCLADDAGEEL